MPLPYIAIEAMPTATARKTDQGAALKRQAGSRLDDHQAVLVDGQPLVVCEHCDAVYRRKPLQGIGRAARCLRCGAVLYRSRLGGVDAMLALSLAGLIVFIVANSFPILAINLSGQRSQTTMLGAVQATVAAGVSPVGLIAALTVFVFPLMQFLMYLYVLIPLRLGSVPHGFVPVMRLLGWVRPWSMVEVFLLGILVALVKLLEIATIYPKIGIWAFAILTILVTALTSFDLEVIWDAAEERDA